MAQNIYITYTENTASFADTIFCNVFANSKILISDQGMTSDDLRRVAKKCPTEFFYVIHADAELTFSEFDFSFKPDPWDAHYLHVWGDKNLVKLYHKKSVLANADIYSDSAILAGQSQLKVSTDNIYSYPDKDVVFISYDESSAESNFDLLKTKFPLVKRVKGVKGIYQAHLTAAELVTTELFYVVDADAVLVEGFDFSYHPSSYDILSTHVWYSTNPINDLVYGYGGVKMFSKKLLLNYTGDPVDFTTSVSKSLKVMPQISNITQFNTDEFSAWRSGFRECAKLAAKLIQNQDNAETEHRLNVWQTVGSDRLFGMYAIEGANAGERFGKQTVDKSEIALINNYDWLRMQFNNAFPGIPLLKR